METPLLFLSGESHGQRNLEGYSPKGHKELDMTEHAYAAAAAKSLQSCSTLCDPIDSSPLGSSVPGILQARILEWVAISFSNTTEQLHYAYYKILAYTPCLYKTSL